MAPAVKSADLCWGQRYLWLRYQQVPAWSRHEAHIVANCSLPDGISLIELRTALNYLIRRHEALRTVYDATAHPWPQQRVQAAAPLPLIVATTESDGTPGPAEIVAELTTAGFDLTADWPIRACAVTTGAVPKRLVVVLNHIAFDDWSLDTFRSEFEAVIAASATRRRATLAPVPAQPSDLARYEASRPAGETSVARDHWRDELCRLPADVFAARRTRVSRPDGQTKGQRDSEQRNSEHPQAHSASLTSPSMLEASREIAGRHQVWPSAVHLAAYAVVTAAYTGQTLIPFRWLTSHREASKHPTVMTCMFSPTLVSVGVEGDPPFSEVVRRAAVGVAQAQAHAYLPYDQVLEAVARESARRGQPVRIAADLNFLSYAPRSCGTRRERFTRNPPPNAWAQTGSDSYFRVYEWQDGVSISLQGSEAVLPAPALEAFLRSYARLIEVHRDATVDLRATEVAELAGFDLPETREQLWIGPDRVDVAGTEAPTTEAERALATAVAEVNDLDRVEMTSCYVVCGGRLLRAPAVLELLRRCGWGGLGLDQLCGVLPLRALAGMLAPTG